MPPRKYRPGIDLCSVEGCDKNAIARGMCSDHYNKWRQEQIRHGTMLPAQRESGENKWRLVLYVPQSVIDYLDATDQPEAERNRASMRRRRRAIALLEQDAKQQTPVGS